MWHPEVQLNNFTFKDRTQFWQDGFLTISANLQLLPDPVTVGRDRHAFRIRRSFCLFVIFRRWSCGSSYQVQFSHISVFFAPMSSMRVFLATDEWHHHHDHRHNHHDHWHHHHCDGK
jgi:hypothetical protein